MLFSIFYNSRFIFYMNVCTQTMYIHGYTHVGLHNKQSEIVSSLLLVIIVLYRSFLLFSLKVVKF